MTQAGGLGIALGLELGHLLPTLLGDVPTTTLTVAMATAAAVAGSLTALLSNRGDEHTEALTSWIFLVCGAGMIVLVAHSPFGLKEIQDRLASSVIGAGEADVVTYAILLVAWGGACLALWRPLTLLLVDRAMASASGLKVRTWEFVLAVAIGLTVGVAVRGMGMLLTFGALILPGLIARSVCRDVRSLFWVAPLIGLAGGIIGFVAGNYWDSPQGPLTIVLLGAMAMTAPLGRRIFRGS